MRSESLNFIPDALNNSAVNWDQRIQIIYLFNYLISSWAIFWSTWIKCPSCVYLCKGWPLPLHKIMYTYVFVYRYICIRRGADKSLARPTSRCLRTESIVSLEGGVCLCAELQVFSCYRCWKEAYQATRAISTTSKRELSSSVSPPHKARSRRKFTQF